jgi:cysteine desulfurase/selenocysteine lyase
VNIESIRKNYAITEHDNYLNHAATAPIANTAIERMQTLALGMKRPLGEHFYAWLGILEDTRRRIAELINAHPTEIAFCQNTSTGLSLIANAIAFQPGDRILVPRNEFPSNIYIWQSLQSKGVIFEFFDVEAGIPVVETLKKLNLTSIKLISMSAVSYLTGRHYELREIATFCRERNILICYDAIQAIGAVPLDVKEIQADFIASGAQKWLLGSIGIGFLYARKELLENLTVPLVGWASVKYPEDFSIKELDFSADMTRFEPGLPDILPVAALNQSLRDFTDIGWEAIYAQINANTLYLTQSLNEYGIQTFSQHDKTAGIVAFNVPHSLDLHSLLTSFAKNKIHVTQREDYIRVSPHFYNTKAELDTFLSALKINASAIYSTKKNTISEFQQQKCILISGATGVVGKAFADKLAGQGYSLALIGKNSNKLNELKLHLLKNYQISVHTEQADFNEADSFTQLLQRLKQSAAKYYAFINCAGIAETDEFIHLPAETLKSLFQVNCIASFQLMQLFLTDLKAKKALGLLNIVSATGRCGWPLLSGYAASQAALWSMSEVLARELSNQNEIVATTYVAPPMHSRMQKRLGRAALRYFKLSGEFPYEQAKVVANEAWQIFENKKTTYISRHNRLTLWINALMPRLINTRIKKIWKN